MTASDLVRSLENDSHVFEFACRDDIQNAYSASEWEEHIRQRYWWQSETNVAGRVMDAFSAAKDPFGYIGRSTKRGAEERRKARDAGAVYAGIVGAVVRRPLAGISVEERNMMRLYAKALADGLIENVTADAVNKHFAWGGGECLIALPTVPEHQGKSGELVREFYGNALEGGGSHEQWVASLKLMATRILEATRGTQGGVEGERMVRRGARWFHLGDMGASVYEEARALDSSGKTVFTGDCVILGGLGENMCVGYSHAPSLLTVARPGQGKSQAQVIPSLLTFRGSAVVLDVKGELYAETHRARRRMGHEVIRWNPFDDGGHSYNPFSFINRSPDRIWQDCVEMADLLVPDNPKVSEPMWVQQAKELAAALICQIVLDKDEDESELAFILRCASLAPEKAFAQFKEMEAVGFESGVLALRDAAGFFQGLSSGSTKTYVGVLSELRGALRLFQGPLIQKALSRSDWRPATLREKPTTVYLTLPDGNLRTWAPLLRLILGQHFSELRLTGQAGLTSPYGLPVTFFLDEAGAIGNFPELVEVIARGRGYGIRVWSFFQDMGQIEEVYENPRGFLASCEVKCFMSPQADDAAKISEWLGDVIDDVIEHEEKLARGEGLAGPDFANQVIVLGGETYPARLERLYAYKYFSHLK